MVTRIDSFPPPFDVVTVRPCVETRLVLGADGDSVNDPAIPLIGVHGGMGIDGGTLRVSSILALSDHSVRVIA